MVYGKYIVNIIKNIIVRAMSDNRSSFQKFLKGFMPNTNDGLKNTQRQQNPTLKVFKKRLKKVLTYC